MKEIKFCNIDGIQVGHSQNIEAATGCTVIISKEGATSGVDVRGGSPGTRETDLLDASNMVEKCNSVVLSGGSAYGLDSCSGVMKYLEENNIGFDAGNFKVPIVCGAVIFDLDIGSSSIRPNLAMGYDASVNSDKYRDDTQGNIGAGTGATTSKILGNSTSIKGGFGSYAIEINGLQVGACVIVNAMGDVICPDTGEVIAAPYNQSYEFLNTEDIMLSMFNNNFNPLNSNTTIGCVVTNATFNKAQAKKISSIAHNGFARTIFPCHTMFDGDTIFTMCTGKVQADINLVGILARKCMEKAIIRGVKCAQSLHNTLSYNDIKKLRI